MNELGDKLRELRKRKGLSQEELAEAAKVNLRTIQRIENSECEPREKTLRLICQVLEVDREELIGTVKSQNDPFLFYFHLSALSFLVIPLGNVIVPLVLWLTKRDSVDGLNESGKNLLNFQILWSVLASSSIIFFAYFKVNHLEGGSKFLTFWACLQLLNLIVPVYFAVRSRKGHYRSYPRMIPFLR